MTPGNIGPGPAPTEVTVTVHVTETVRPVESNHSNPYPGVIVGSVVGGAAFGALLTIVAVSLAWYLKRRESQSAAVAAAASDAVSSGPYLHPSMQYPYELDQDAAAQLRPSASGAHGY